jgi:hypothetical protein
MLSVTYKPYIVRVVMLSVVVPFEPNQMLVEGNLKGASLG